MYDVGSVGVSKQEKYVLLNTLSPEAYVTNIPHNIHEDSLKSFLQRKYTGISRVKVCRTPGNSSKSAGRGYVLFKTIADAQTFCAHKIEYEGSTLEPRHLTIQQGVLQHSITKVNADCLLILGEEMQDGKVACLYESKNPILSVQYWKQKIFVSLNDRIRMTFPFSSLKQVVAVDRTSKSVVMELVVRSPPDLHKEKNKIDGSDTHSKEEWYRISDFTNGVLGLCYKYRIVATQNLSAWDSVVKKLEEYKLVEHKKLNQEYKATHILPLPKNHLPFFDQLMVEALLSSHLMPDPRIGGDINKFEEFISSLTSSQDSMNWNFHVLRRMVIDQRWLDDPSANFKSAMEITRTVNPNLDLPGHVWVCRVLVTPTRIHIPAPELELTNRVLRDTRFTPDQFLRVNFVGENLRPVLPEDLSDNVLARIRLFLEKGFEIACRRYQFFGYSASQLRRCSCWFFSGEHIWKVIQSLGNFSENHSVPKYAARIGQCFSSAYATIPIDLGKSSVEFEHGEDIKNKKYNFSDGHGQIPPHLAQQVVETIRANYVFSIPHSPSSFQFRLAGYKGVVTVHLPADKMLLRDSMRKFKPRQDVNTFEVIAVSHFVAATLNRPAITLLSHGGVPDSVIIERQESEIKLLTSMLESDENALKAVRAIGSQFDTGFIAEQMLEAGFSVHTDPFLHDLLSAFCAQRLRNLKTKACIYIPKGGCFMGILDELRTLEEGEVFIQINCPITKKKIVIEGTVLVFKNPVAHPGDIRKLRAVNNPSLYNLEDVLVFPAKGKRPHANEASGSDLDGDVYTLIYDPDFVNPFRQSNPGQYEAPKSVMTNPVTYAHLIEWFLRYIKEDRLGLLGNSHLIHADKSSKGPSDQKCLELVRLYTLAVDFAKTGVMETLPNWVRVHEYPDFMGKKHKHAYRSEKLLGRLFRSVPQYEPIERTKIAIDPEMVYEGHLDFLPEALQLKIAYDYQLLGILNQYGVTEREAIGGCVAKFKGEFSKRADQQASLALSNQVSALRQKYAKLFNEGLENAATKTRYAKASAWYIATYRDAIERNGKGKAGEGKEEGKGEEEEGGKNGTERKEEGEDKEEGGIEKDRESEHLHSFCWVIWTDCIALKQTKAHRRN